MLISKSDVVPPTRPLTWILPSRRSVVRSSGPEPRSPGAFLSTMATSTGLPNAVPRSDWPLLSAVFPSAGVAPPAGGAPASQAVRKGERGEREKQFVHEKVS